MKKGFTLIELLAVIVILAVIALISTPIIMEVISGAKDEALKDSTYGIIKAAEQEVTTSILDDGSATGIYEHNGTELTNGTNVIEYSGEVYDQTTVSIEADGDIRVAIYDEGTCVKGDLEDLYVFDTDLISCKLSNGDVIPHYYGAGFQSNFFKLFEKTNGNYILTGHSQGTGIDFSLPNNGDFDGIILEVDQDWNTVWLDNVGSPATDYSQSGAANGTDYFLSGSYNAVGGDFTTYMDWGDSYLSKYTEDGTRQWILTLNSRYSEGLRGFEFLADGTIVAVGNYDYPIDDFSGVGGNVRNYMMLTIEADGSSFQVQDSLNYGTNDSEWGTGIIKTSDGGFLVSAASRSSGVEADAILIKYDSSYNREWLKRYTGSGDESFYDLLESSDGGYVLVGSTESTDGDFTGITNKGSSDTFIMKVDSLGNKQWLTSVGGVGHDLFTDMIESKDGGYIAVGLESSSMGDPDLLGSESDASIYKFDTDGTLLWKEIIGGNRFDYFNAVLEKTDGTLILAGSTDSDDGYFKGSGASSDAAAAILVEYIPYDN